MGLAAQGVASLHLRPVESKEMYLVTAGAVHGPVSLLRLVGGDDPSLVVYQHHRHGPRTLDGRVRG